MGRNNVRPRFKAGDIVEVWDMSVGEWQRAVVCKQGSIWKARQYHLRKDDAGVSWRPVLSPGTRP